jgi:plasmid maintenance system antidote protein VapI
MLVKSVMFRKVRPIHPGEIIRDILEERDISINSLYLNEILEGKRSITFLWAKEIEKELGISTQLLLNLQRKVDIWDSLYDN